MAKVWKLPEGEKSALYTDFLAQTHFLIAGATGAGKSTVINGMMHAALYDSPARKQFILIDPKGTELDEYKNLPHTLLYADGTHDPKDQPMKACVEALEYAMQIVRARMAEMKRRKEREWTGSDVYVIIDELMILMTRAKRTALPVMQDLLSLARCAHVRLVACTQSPVALVLPTPLKCNFDSRLALRTVCAQDSRNIVGIAGCENFPNPVTDHKAYGLYRHGAVMETYQLQRISDEERHRLVNYWMHHKKPVWKLFA